MQSVESRKGHDRRYSVNIDKITALGWKKKRTLDGALSETVQWYRDNRWWWEPIRSGEFREYYDRQYAERLAGPEVK